ncbi:MAG: hypothetical protein AAFQ98_07535 [Bacteroidota bacterium]
MGTKKKGMLTPPGEYAKHFRKEYSRMFWKKERQAEKDLIRKEGTAEDGSST